MFIKRVGHVIAGHPFNKQFEFVFLTQVLNELDLYLFTLTCLIP